MSYQWATGHDNTAGYVDFAINPRVVSIIEGQRFFNLDQGSTIDGFLRCELEYTALQDSQLDTLLTDFAFTATNSQAITITLPLNKTRVMSNYNATLHYPTFEQARFERGFWYNVTFLLTGVFPAS